MAELKRIIQIISPVLRLFVQIARSRDEVLISTTSLFVLTLLLI